MLNSGIIFTSDRYRLIYIIMGSWIQIKTAMRRPAAFIFESRERPPGGGRERIGIGESFTASPSPITIHTGPDTAVHAVLDEDS